VSFWANKVAVFVKRPECMSEEILGVIFALEANETIPVFPKAVDHAFISFLPAKELSKDC
jgi:hypothetical protein